MDWDDMNDGIYEDGSETIGCQQNEDYGMVEESESHNSMENVGESHVNFTGHIDDLYDHSINQAKSNYIAHAEDFVKAHDAAEAQLAIDHMRQDLHDEEYWEECKHDAEVESRKNQIFLDGINAQKEIIEKYRK